MVIYSRNMRQIPKNDEKKDEKRSNPLSRGDVPGGKLLPVAPGCNNSNGKHSHRLQGLQHKCNQKKDLGVEAQLQLKVSRQM